jgi:5-methyltetrahydrofolate corrinoid/iron sulfur protein methyltransferase
MLIVADNLQVVNPVVAEAVCRLDPEPIRQLVLRCRQAGAQAFDINSGPLPKAPAKYFSFLVETVQSITSLPLLLDTTNPAALEAGLRVCRRPAVINGFSLEPVKLERILPLAVEYDADIIGYLLGPGSQVPVEEEDMMALAVEIFEAFCRTGLGPERLIIDPVIAPLRWDSGLRHNQAIVNLIRTLPDLLGTPVRTIAGISNLVSGPVPVPRKIELESAFLPMLAAAGLNMALLNVFHQPTVHTVGLCDAFLGDKVFVI